METVTSRDGTEIAFELRGSGPPLLLVHGTTADHTRWDHISSRFEGDCTVVAMDRRGRGGSGDGPDYDIAREAEDVAAVVDAMGQPVYLLGHSFGGVCALEAALLTDEVARMVLYEPPLPTGVGAMLQPGLVDRIQALIDEGRNVAALDLFALEVVRMPESDIGAFHQSPMWPGRIRMAPTLPRELGFDQSYTFEPEKFRGLEVPTLILLGGDSPPVFRMAAEAAAEALPRATLVELPGQQHIAMDTAPELFAEEVLGFLRN